MRKLLTAARSTRTPRRFGLGIAQPPDIGVDITLRLAERRPVFQQGRVGASVRQRLGAMEQGGVRLVDMARTRRRFSLEQGPRRPVASCTVTRVCQVLLVGSALAISWASSNASDGCVSSAYKPYIADAD